MEQAERLMEGKSLPGADPDEVRELLNFRKAFEFVSEYLEDGGPITEGLVREIHQRIVHGVMGLLVSVGATNSLVYRLKRAELATILRHSL